MTRLRVGVLRALPVGVGVFVVFVVLNTLPAVLFGRDVVVFTVLLPFLAAAVCALGVRSVLGPVDRFVERITRLRTTTPYSVLAEAAARTRTGMLDTALPGLAEVLANGTAARAVIWVVVSDRLVAAAFHPPPRTPFPEVANIAVLLDRPDVDHVVPIVEGDVLRAALDDRQARRVDHRGRPAPDAGRGERGPPAAAGGRARHRAARAGAAGGRARLGAAALPVAAHARP